MYKKSRTQTTVKQKSKFQKESTLGLCQAHSDPGVLTHIHCILLEEEEKIKMDLLKMLLLLGWEGLVKAEEPKVHARNDKATKRKPTLKAARTYKTKIKLE